MKKFLFGVFAIAGLVACVQEDVLNAPNHSEEIAFGGFVAGATRSEDPSTKSETIDHFTVWAYVDDSIGKVLENELVTKSGDAWTYSNVQYWVNKHNYRFFAISPYGNGVGNVKLVDGESLDKPYDNGLGKIEFTNVNGTEDVLYASNNEDTMDAIPESVKFEFDHILSKVKFTFKNGFATENSTLVIEDIEMVVPNKATVVLNGHDDYTWENHEGETTLALGDAIEATKIAALAKASSDYERLTIPAGNDKAYKVTFTATLYAGEIPLVTKEFETTIQGIELVAGKAYNFAATLDHESFDLKPIVFEVIVDEWDETGDTAFGPFAGSLVHVATIDELQAALNATPEKYPYNILLTEDLVGNVVAPEVANEKVIINGQGHEFKGSIQVDGKTNYYKGTTVFENIHFVSDDASTLVNGDSFIYSGTLNGNTSVRYPDNITVKDCTFTATGAAVDKAVAVKVWSLNGNLVITNSTANGLHSLAQLTSCSETNLLVDGVVVENCKSGISVSDAGNVVIKNSTITSREYGIRANGCDANTTVEASTITATQPIVVRKATSGCYNLALGAGVVLNTSETYQVIFTTGSDDAAYVAPNAANYTFSSVETVYAFPTTQLTGLEGTTLTLPSSESAYTLVLGELKDVTITGDGTTAIIKTTADTKIENVTINNVNFEYTGATADCGLVVNANAQIDNLVIDGCTFVGTGAKAGRGLSGLNNSASITISNSTFKDLGYPIYAWGSYASLVVDTCTFNNIKSWAIMPQSGFDGDLTVNNCNFVDCLGGGLVKAGTLTAGHTFTFTNNTITGCTVSGDHNWFQFNVSAGTTVIANNTKDGEAWTPSTADGLK